MAYGAGDPFIGTWKMNPAKTKHTVGTAPKEQICTIVQAGSDQNMKVAGIAADGTKTLIRYMISPTGGTGKMLESSLYDGVFGKRIGPNEWEMSYTNGGKAVYTARSRVSSDGLTLTVDSKGVNALGQTVEASFVYDKKSKVDEYVEKHAVRL